MRIIHINDVANVASTMVDALQVLNQNASLIHLNPLGGSLPLYLKLLLLPQRLQELYRTNRKVLSSSHDIVHIHYAYLGWLGIIGRYQYFLHCHGTDVRMDLNHPVRKTWVIPSLKRATKVFFSTPDLGNLVRSYRSDAIFLPNPVRTDLFRPAEYKDSHNNIRILLFCDLNDKVKGTDIAIKALSQLRETYPFLSISAFNKGIDVSKYNSISWIKLLKPVSYREMPKFLNSFDIIVGQLVIGSLGMSELESMASGKPIVTYFNFPEYYSEFPPILSAHDPNGVATHLAKLIEEPTSRLELGMKGREWVEKYHCYLTIAKELLNIYQDTDRISLGLYNKQL